MSVSVTQRHQQMRMLADQVLVRRHGGETAQGKLVVPDRAVEVPLRGTVVVVGPGLRVGDVVTPPAVAPGDVVLFARYAGTEMQIDGAPRAARIDLLGVIETA